MQRYVGLDGRLYNEWYHYNLDSVLMRISLGFITTSTGSSPTVTASVIVIVPFPDTMRITFGSITASTGSSTSTPSTLGMIPSNVNSKRHYSGNNGLIYDDSLFYIRFDTDLMRIWLDSMAVLTGVSTVSTSSTMEVFPFLCELFSFLLWRLRS